MEVHFTKHAEDKLNRPDIKRFKINKKMIKEILKDQTPPAKTKSGGFTIIGSLDQSHVLRIIYDIIGDDRKVITFHITRKGRYEA